MPKTVDMQQSSATQSLHLSFWGLWKIVACSQPYLAVPSCIYSFWHGVIPTSYFIFNDFYTCTCYFAAIHVEFNRAGVFETNVEERLSFNCTAPPYHMSELLEIGQTETIEELLLRSPQPGDPASCYDPENCQFTDEGSHCSKITVTEAMVGKAFQCRSFKRG